MTKQRLLDAIARERAGERRGRMLNIRLSADEWARLEAAASQHGLRPSPFARTLVFAALAELEEGGARRGTK